MRGSRLIENERDRSSSLPAAYSVRAVLACGAVGVLAGILAGHVRLGLGLPGHKALVWMTPVVFARLVFGSPAGGTTGAVTAGFTTMALGSRFAGAAAHLPMAGLAGAIIDLAVGFGERRRLGRAWGVVLVGGAGLAANLVMLGKRLMAPLGHSHALLGAGDLPVRLISYAAFGLAAGLAAALLALAAAGARRRRANRGG